MSNQGDDCYFYFYSTCTKGDSCPFRHCKAALGNETVCTLWQESRCFRQICKFRHMEIDKKRSTIPCFWENQLSGCRKGNCAFHHTKGRYVDGVYIPPCKTQIAKPEPSEMDIQVSQTSSKLTAASTTHLRGVKTKEAVENVPSPTHPPVVINATDDDEDDDDQISEEGDELKPSGHQGARHVTTQKMDVLSKGVISTLNVQECSSNPVNIEKNITLVRTVMFSKNDPPGIHRNLSQRLGKRKVFSQESPLDPPDVHRNLSQRLGKRKVFSQESPSAVSGGESVPTVKKTLSERLGKKMISPVVAPGAHHKKIQVPRLLKDRLGLPPEQNSTETEKAANPTTDFHIKTLQEIQKEKASQRPEQQLECRTIKIEDHFCLKSHIFIKPPPDIRVKSLHEIQAEKKLRQLKDGEQKDENNVDKTDCRVGRGLHTNQNFEDKNLPESEKKKLGSQACVIWKRFCEKGIKPSHFTDIVPSSSVSLKETKAISQPVEKVQIKTLEEIRKKTAFRIKHNRQAINTEVLKSVSQPQVKLHHKRILRLSKPQVSKETDQDTNSQTNNAATAADTKTTVNCETPVSTLKKKKNTEKVGSDKTFGIQSLNNADFTDTQKITQHEVGCSVKPSKIILVNKSKVMKKQSPTKTILQQKAQQRSPVAEVKPMNTTVTSTDKERTTVLLSTVESLVSQHARSISPKLLKESSQVPASDPGHSGTAPTSRRASIALLGKPSILTEDDFDELIWDISDGKLDDEIDLDPSKDEDDLLMELSEMIDS